MESLVSIIVPVYNRETYIEQCITCLINQSYKNIEIVVVDDGSTDRSGEICESFAAADRRVKVIHQENGGVSRARNVGVLHAQGEHICFVDSDDYVAPNYVKYLYGLLTESGAELACCGFENTSRRDWTVSEDQDEYFVCTGTQACRIMLSGQPGKELLLSSLWGKLYAAETVRQYGFPEGRLFEDTATTYKYLYSCKKIAVGSKKLYAYFKNEDGIISKSYKEKNYDRIVALVERAEFFEEKEEKQLAKSAWKFTLRFLYADSYANDDRCVNEMQEILRSKWLKGYIPFDILVRCSAYLVSPRLYRKIRNSVLG